MYSIEIDKMALELKNSGTKVLKLAIEFDESGNKND